MEILKDIVTFLWALGEVRFLVGHIAVNAVTAVAISFYLNEFHLKKLGEFLWRKLLPYTLIYGAVRVAGQYANLEIMAPIVWTVIEASLMGDLLENMKKIGIPIPDKLVPAQ